MLSPLYFQYLVRQSKILCRTFCLPFLWNYRDAPPKLVDQCFQEPSPELLLILCLTVLMMLRRRMFFMAILGLKRHATQVLASIKMMLSFFWDISSLLTKTLTMLLVKSICKIFVKLSFARTVLLEIFDLEHANILVLLLVTLSSLIT